MTRSIRSIRRHGDMHSTGGHLPVKRPLIGAVRDTLVGPGCSDAVNRLLRLHFRLPTASIHQQHTQHCSSYGTLQLVATHNFTSTAAQLLLMVHPTQATQA